jgi:isopenicillin-N epimerase
MDHNFVPDFEKIPHFIYLNSGTMALSPLAVRQAMHRYEHEFELNPADGLFSAWEKCWKVQKDLAHFLHADPADLYLRNNVTYAMNDVIMALNLPRGSEILISDLEYGAIINICRHKAQLDGLELKTFSTPKNSRDLSEAQLIDSVMKAVTAKTKAVMISHVTTGSGLVFPIEKIARELKQKKIFSLIDGAHGAGFYDLDFSKTAVDFYGSNLHKWFMGPKGTGFGWVAKSLREHLTPRFAGWTSFELAPHHQHFGDRFTARWMICSTHDFAPIYAISDVVKYWDDKGPAVIRRRQSELRDLCENVVKTRTGWSPISTEDPALKGPMVAFALPEKLRAQQFDLMWFLKKEKSLQVSMTVIHGEWCLRLAPHIYNTEQEIEQAAQILSAL